MRFNQAFPQNSKSCFGFVSIWSEHLPLLELSRQELFHGICSVLPSFPDKHFASMTFHIDRQHNVIVDSPCVAPPNCPINWPLATNLLSGVVFPSHLSQAPNFEPLPNHSPISSSSLPSLLLSLLLFPQRSLIFMIIQVEDFRNIKWAVMDDNEVLTQRYQHVVKITQSSKQYDKGCVNTASDRPIQHSCNL